MPIHLFSGTLPGVLRAGWARGLFIWGSAIPPIQQGADLASDRRQKAAVSADPRTSTASRKRKRAGRPKFSLAFLAPARRSVVRAGSWQWQPCAYPAAMAAAPADASTCPCSFDASLREYRVRRDCLVSRPQNAESKALASRVVGATGCVGTSLGFQPGLVMAWPVGTILYLGGSGVPPRPTCPTVRGSHPPAEGRRPCEAFRDSFAFRPQ